MRPEVEERLSLLFIQLREVKLAMESKAKEIEGIRSYLSHLEEITANLKDYMTKDKEDHADGY